jgi:hypothetical protein
MTCTSCKRPNHEGRRFCGGCGHGLTPACVACGFENERDDRFCGGCGKGLADAPVVVAKPAPVPQRDELAGLFDAPKSTRALPTIGIGQEDIDHLFGGGA